MSHHSSHFCTVSELIQQACHICFLGSVFYQFVSFLTFRWLFVTDSIALCNKLSLFTWKNWLLPVLHIAGSTLWLLYTHSGSVFTHKRRSGNVIHYTSCGYGDQIFNPSWKVFRMDFKNWSVLFMTYLPVFHYRLTAYFSGSRLYI